MALHWLYRDGFGIRSPIYFGSCCQDLPVLLLSDELDLLCRRSIDRNECLSIWTYLDVFI